MIAVYILYDHVSLAGLSLFFIQIIDVHNSVQDFQSIS